MSSELQKALQSAFELRKQEDSWTEQKVADLVGCSKTTVHHVVKVSSQRPAKGSKALPKICQVLGVDLAAFLPLDEEQRGLLRALAIARAVGRADDFLEHVKLGVKLVTHNGSGSS